MSPPDTNIEKQEKRHKGPLAGMAGVVIFAAILIIALVAWLSFRGNDPGDVDDNPVSAPETNESAISGDNEIDPAETAPAPAGEEVEPVSE